MRVFNFHTRPECSTARQATQVHDDLADVADRCTACKNSTAWSAALTSGACGPPLWRRLSSCAVELVLAARNAVKLPIEVDAHPPTRS
jgi:hypothetical protein